jgi:hypothetical protein
MYMSVVTNIILAAALDEYGVDLLNAALGKARLGGRLERMDKEAGGTKVMEAAIWLAAFNHLNLEAFVAMVKTVEWETPGEVSLFVKEQEDDVFREIDLGFRRG